MTAGLCLILAAGCTRQLRAASAGQIGCRADDVVISEDTGGWGLSRTWLATCENQAYSCSAVSTGKDSGQVACSPLKPAHTAATVEKAKTLPSGSVSRGFDNERQLPFVQGTFQLPDNLTLSIVGGPSGLNDGKLRFALSGRTLDNQLRACQQLVALVNAQPIEPASSSVKSNVRMVQLESDFDAQPFAPLQKSFPEFTLKACHQSWSFEESQLNQLKKLLTIHADLAQSPPPASLDAAVPPSPDAASSAPSETPAGRPAS